MALFQRRQSTDIATLYTMSGSKTKLVVGLGNPGKKYDGTRHNAGFMALDYFVTSNEFPGWSAKKDLNCELSMHTVAGVRVIAVKPSTFMNLSGEAVQAVQRFYKVSNADTIVVYDELDLPFGQIRTRRGGSDAGHNGVKSLIQHLGEDFGRIRVGISNDISAMADSADFVLGRFTEVEQSKLDAMRKEVNALLNESILGGEIPAETRSYL
jgi:PTH1 family peptidyl-tRNA hydrolase